jgi:hypothetical protein
LTITGSDGHRCRVHDEAFPLLIAVALTPEDRLKLAERVEGIAPLLLVSTVDELRRLIAPGSPMPVLPEPAVSAPDLLTIDSARSKACWGDQEVPLTRLEHDLLTCLNTPPLRVWTFDELHRAVWRGAGSGVSDVQSLVKRLRRKLAGLGTTVTIAAVRGTGLRLTDQQRPAVGQAGSA